MSPRQQRASAAEYPGILAKVSLVNPNEDSWFTRFGTPKPKAAAEAHRDLFVGHRSAEHACACTQRAHQQYEYHIVRGLPPSSRHVAASPRERSDHTCGTTDRVGEVSLCAHGRACNRDAERW
eukprot:9504135-Pyramimonas_sp.AAC.3